MWVSKTREQETRTANSKHDVIKCHTQWGQILWETCTLSSSHVAKLSLCGTFLSDVWLLFQGTCCCAAVQHCQTDHSVGPVLCQTELEGPNSRTLCPPTTKSEEITHSPSLRDRERDLWAATVTFPLLLHVNQPTDHEEIWNINVFFPQFDLYCSLKYIFI